MSIKPTMKERRTLLVYSLTKTTQRLTFDIIEQAHEVTYFGDDDGPYFKFVASNDYQVISRSRMDIQTERIWLLGAKCHDEHRSGTMTFSNNAKRDAAYEQFIRAINEWATHNGGVARQVAADFGTRQIVDLLAAAHETLNGYASTGRIEMDLEPLLSSMAAEQLLRQPA